MVVKVRQRGGKRKGDDILAEFVYNRGSVSEMKTEKKRNKENRK